jgi:hypothetical protein
MSKRKTSLTEQVNGLFAIYRTRPKGAKGKPAIKRDRKLALRKLGIKL